MVQRTLDEIFRTALGHHQAGRLGEAEALYRQILLSSPDHPAIVHLLGVVAGQKGDNQASIEMISRAIAITPGVAVYHNDLGESYRRASQLETAIACFERAIQLDGEFAQAHNNLGVALIHGNQLEKAVASFRRAIEVSPDFAMAHSNLGNALTGARQLDEAIAAYRRAIQLQPNYAEAQFNLGNAMKEKGQLDDAIAAYEKCIAIKPDYAAAHGNLGSVLMLKNLVDEAIASITASLRLNARQPIAMSNLGNAWMAQGRVDEAMKCYRAAMLLDPQASKPHSNLLYSLNFAPERDPWAVAEEYRQWNRLHAEPLKKLIQPHGNDTEPDRRLRIGYVSPDFCNQAESFFVMPLLESHDHEPFEIHCYSSVIHEDGITRRMRKCADHWHDVAGLDDGRLAEKIRQDGIDVLIDLTMHMADNRLLVFARKPAPVQITWLAYPGTTGLETMDYRLTDPYLDAVGVTQYYSERSICLPQTWCCYDPLIEMSAAGRREGGPIRFGSLNNPCKINFATLKLWSLSLGAIAGSTLLLLSAGPSHERRVRQEIESLGIDAGRVRFFPRSGRGEYLRAYERIDIALDPVPYNGITTTCDALWMGIPVVALAGATAAGRAGLSLLSNLNLGELIADTPEDFARITSDLANDLPRLGEFRGTLRRRMERSPLMDYKQFAAAMESLYRRVWRNWCKGEKAD